MSLRVAFVCDACGASVDTPSRTVIPKGWIAGPLHLHACSGRCHDRLFAALTKPSPSTAKA